jgi:uncharacterized RDD family membrane protein YckC
MTYNWDSHRDSDLPDPDTDPQFYEGVTSKRVVAWIIDSILIMVLSFLAAILTFGVGFFFLPFLALVVSLAYRIFTLASASATPGMQFMGIEFRTLTGDKMDLMSASLHTLIFTTCFSILIGQIVSIIMTLADARGRGVADAFLGTVAINRPR